MSWIELAIISAIIGILVAIGYEGYADLKQPHILLKKSEWECNKIETRTYMQPMVVGKTTTMMPMTEDVCVDYHRL